MDLKPYRGYTDRHRLSLALRFIREVKGMTQEQMGEALGIATSTVQRWEKGWGYPITVAQRSILGRLVQVGTWAVLDETPRHEMTDIELEFNKMIDQMQFIERRKSTYA